LSPVSSNLVETLAIVPEEVCDIENNTTVHGVPQYVTIQLMLIIQIWVAQHAVDRKQETCDSASWRLATVQDIQVNVTIAVDVGMEYLGCKTHLGLFVWVVGWDDNIHEEHPPAYGESSGSDTAPCQWKHIIIDEASRATPKGAPRDVLQIHFDSVNGHEKVRW
jgi:hypothetical protein